MEISVALQIITYKNVSKALWDRYPYHMKYGIKIVLIINVTGARVIFPLFFSSRYQISVTRNEPFWLIWNQNLV